MKIQAITGSTIYEATQNALLTIDRNDATTPYFVVVPDRFTLQAEKLLFKLLDKKASFNINIVGLSSLAGKVLKDNNIETLTPLDGVLIVEKIMRDFKDKLQYFTKHSSSLCQELYNTIEQIKSSKITCQQISEKTKSANLSKKIADIKLIYENYEKMRLGRADTDDVIQIFSEKIVEQKLYQGAIFLFVGFDSFTTANFEVISALTSTAKEIRFSLCKPLSLSNAFIYENDILNKLKRIAEKENVEIELVSPISNFNEEQTHLVKNVFSRDIQERSSDHIFVANSGSLREEVLFVAKSIKKAVYDGARFRDFAIVCPSLDDYKTEIEICFKKFNIVHYIDKSALLTETALARFVKKCFSIVARGFLKEDILFFLSSRFVKLENREEIIAFVNEKKISGRDKFEFYVEKFSPIFKFLLSLKEQGTYVDYAEFLINIVKFIENEVQEFIVKQEELGFIQEASFERQAFEALKEVASSFQKIDVEVEIKDFCSILLTALDSKEISSLPSFCDQVFVGDSAKSFFSSVKYLYVLGANAGKLPQNSNDNGLLTDAEIENSCFSRILEPTIKMINKRNRFKLFSLLAQAEERLVLSYLNFNEEGQKQEKAYFVTSLMSAFGVKSSQVLQTNAFIPATDEGLLFMLGNQQEARIQLPSLIKSRNKYVGSLRSALNFEKEQKLNRSSLDKDLVKDLLFKGGNVKVTQLEKFYDCPFKQFMDNGIRPVEKKFAEVKPNMYGTIMHNLLEAFVKTYASKIDSVKDDDIWKFIENNIEKYIDENFIEFLSDKEIFLKELTSNSFKLCKRAVYECQNSKFKPKYFEKRVDGRNLKIGQYNLVGMVDRVDTCDDMFRVIDYKTGKIASSLLSSLYYGEKLQLFLYGKALEKELGLDFSGAFYFDAKVSYSKNQSRILTGVFKPKEKVLFALDKRLEDEEFRSSDIVAADKITKGFSKATLNHPSMEKLEDYALEISHKAIEDMENGLVAPCPSKNSCDFCAYNGICLFDKKVGLRALKDASGYFAKEENNE